jgi:hypothetical protein
LIGRHHLRRSMFRLTPDHDGRRPAVFDGFRVVLLHSAVALKNAGNGESGMENGQAMRARALLLFRFPVPDS